jgi:predicted DNA-binding transcriptional regulator AlpA
MAQMTEFTGLPERTIYDQVHRRVGIGALAFKVGRHLRWDWNDIDAWVAQQKAGDRAA